MPTYLTAESLDEITRRLRALKPDSPRKWGALDAHGMLAHLRFTVRMSLGEEPVEDRSTPILSPMIRWFVFRLMPWPKGKIKVPDSFTPPPENDFEAERTACFADLQRFIDTAQREPTRRTLHPMFGMAALKQWRLMHGRHIEHHLTQFGV